MKRFFFILFLFTQIHLSAQHQLSNQATVSVLTCGPGEELYTAFGHSAFRVYDPLLGLDKVYNYGTFDFNAPNFYLNFAKGNLTYQLSTSDFYRFLYTYNYEKRWVKAQVLNLSYIDVQLLYNYLENNALPQNRSYQYDFFYNNCATKIEDVIKKVLKYRVHFSNEHITTHLTHRDLINAYTKNFKWGKFGIDLALGSVIDKEASKDEYKFLPDYIDEAFNNATITYGIKEAPLVKNEGFILKQNEKTTPQIDLLQPIIVFLVLMLWVFFITFKNLKNNTRSKWLDFILYLSTGIIGILVLLLWFATSHTATYKNFNFLWAFAPNIIIAFYVLKKELPQWIVFYNWFLIVLIALLGVLWGLKIQVFNSALLPILILLIVRYGFIIFQERKLSTSKK